MNQFNQPTGVMGMGLGIFEAKSFGDVEAVISLYEYGDNLEVYGDNNGDECYRVLLTLEDETRLCKLFNDRNDARVMTEIEAAEFPRYLSSDEAWTVLRSPSKKNDEDLCSGVAINQSVPGRVVYDPGLYVESFEDLEPRNNSWCLLDGDDSSASNLVGKTFDRWTPPAPVVIEEPIAPVEQSEVIANLNKSVLDASNEDLQFVIDTLKAVIAARGGDI
jgi:hypothetical protein